LEEIFQLADRVTVLRDGESIGTNRVGEMNESSLIKLMVGREISDHLSAVRKGAREIVFSLKNFSCPACEMYRSKSAPEKFSGSPDLSARDEPNWRGQFLESRRLIPAKCFWKRKN